MSYKVYVGDLVFALDNLDLTYDERQKTLGAIQRAWNIVDEAWERERTKANEGEGMWPYLVRKANGPS